MEINVVGLLKEVDAIVEINESGKVEGFRYMGEDIGFDGDVNVKGTLKRQGSKYYILEGNVSAALELQCSSCMEKYKYEVEFPVELHFADKEKAIDNEFDLYYTNGDTVELDEAVQTNVIMNIPAKKLCKESCKGLCSVCGVNLNNECCDCADDASDEEDVIDERFAALKDFFDK